MPRKKVSHSEVYGIKKTPKNKGTVSALIMTSYFVLFVELYQKAVSFSVGSIVSQVL